MLWDGIQAVHPWARKLIPGLLEGKEVDIATLNQIRKRDALVLVDGCVREPLTGSGDKDTIIYELLQTLRKEPFPFRRCPICPTVFALNRKQKYCSTECTKSAHSSAYNSNRKEAARKGMADLRKRRAAKKLKGARA